MGKPCSSARRWHRQRARHYPECTKVLSPRDYPMINPLSRMLSFAALLLAAQIGCASAPAATQGSPARGGIPEADVRRLLPALADDSLEGRAPGSRGSAKAAAIIAREFAAAGLAPAGD